MHACETKASQGHHKDRIPWMWQEYEEDQQVEEEEELPDQKKQPVLGRGQRPIHLHVSRAAQCSPCNCMVAHAEGSNQM